MAALGLSIMMNAHADGKPPAKPSAEDAARFPAGTSRFMFKDWPGPQLRVWVYVPNAAGARAPILFVMHGVERDAKRYLEDWTRLAERHGAIIVAPEFSERRFPGSEFYNQGGVVDARSGAARVADAWTFSVIEPLFDYVRRRSGSGATKYSIYGHSAGGQFVHRFVLMTQPRHLDQAVAANAGWYTLPDPARTYPEGLKLSRPRASGLAASFDRRLTVLLGTDDTETDDRNLRDDDWARAQGDNRLERGRSFFARSEDLARRKDWPFNWRLRYAPGIGHENRKMAAYAAEILFRQRAAMPKPEVLIGVKRSPDDAPCDVKLPAGERFAGLVSAGCPSLDDYQLSVWALQKDAVKAGDDFILIEQPLDPDARQERGRRDQSLTIGVVDAGGKDPRESSSLQRKLDALAERGAGLVFLVNSPTDGRIRKVQPYTLIHLPRAATTRPARGAGAASRQPGLLITVSPDAARSKARVAIYPAVDERAQPGSEFSGPDAGKWKPFSDAVRRIVSRTKDQVRFDAGRDEQGDYLAFDVDWPRGG